MMIIPVLIHLKKSEIQNVMPDLCVPLLWPSRGDGLDSIARFCTGRHH